MSAEWMTRDGHLSVLSLERHLAGEIDASAHLSECATCAARWDALQADAAGPSLRPPVAPTATPRWPIYGGLLAAAAAIVFFVMRLTTGPIDDGDGIRLKGDFALEVHAHDGTRSRQVLDGDTVTAGERLGFRVKSTCGGHLLILGRDAKGEAWLAYPQQGGGKSAPFGPAKAMQDLKQAVQLDAAPGDERLDALLCDAPIDQATAAPILARGAVPPTCRLRQVTLRKKP